MPIMGRRKHTEAALEQHDRWLISYADFITLLFAFFVVMYAMSSVNEGKYRVLSSALNTAFSDIRSDTAAAIAINLPIKPPIADLANASGKEKELVAKREKFRNMSSELKGKLGNLAKEGQVHITEGAFGVTVDINASMLFSAGDAQLHPQAIPALESIAQVLAGNEFPLSVEGHTDNLPIKSNQFPSNWELSAVRASGVVRLFVDNGVSAGRLTATGYADQRPVSDNASTDGRQRNRRVSITIAAPTE